MIFKFIKKTSTENYQFMKFIFIGGINTLFGYGVYLFFLFFGLNFAIAALVSTILGIIFNFSNLTNRVQRQNYATVNNVIKELKFNNIETYLFTNDLKVQADWLFNGFNNIYLTNGFNNSLSDNQIELAFS